MMVVVMVGARVWSLLETACMSPLTGRAAALSAGSMTWDILVKNMARDANFA